jgi:hypothetical protein
MTDCEHAKAMITIDTDEGPKRVCPICDDVDVETLD